MKKIISLIITLSMLLSMVSFIGAFAADEVIFADSFENGMENWTYVSASDKGAFSMLVTDKVSDGKTAIKVVDPDDKTYGFISKPIPCEAGKTYRVYLDTYMEEGMAAHLIIGFYNADNKRVSIETSQTSTLGKWISLKKDVTIPQDIVSIRLHLTGTSAKTGTTYIDNIKIKKVEPKKPKDPINVKLTEGSVIVEAEDAVCDMTYFDETESKSAAEGLSLKSVKISQTQPLVTDKPYIGFNATTESNEEHYLWVRVVSTNSSTDSIWTSVNDDDYQVTGVGSSSKDEEDYIWAKLGIYTPVNNMLKCHFINREYTTVDRFILTDNPAYIPDGMGEKPKQFKKGDVVEMPKDKYPLPPITPNKGEHPRLLFKEADIQAIKANLNHPENQAALAKFNELKEQKFDGILPDLGKKANHDANKLAILEAKAFDYALNKDPKRGREAIDGIINYINTVSYGAVYSNYAETVANGGIYDYSRVVIGLVMLVSAEVYDWCYPLLTAQEKAEIVSGCELFALTMEVGCPPTKMQGISGHGAEYMIQRDWLAFAIAVYDEYPDVYNFVGGRYFEEFVKPKNNWSVSEAYHQGTNYSRGIRVIADLWGQLLINKMSGETVLTPQTGKIPYEYIYAYRPDSQFIREGDASESEAGMPLLMFMAGNFYKDPILRKEYLRDNSLTKFDYTDIHYTPVIHLALNDPTIGIKDYKTIPTTKYFGSPMGKIISHTTWDRGLESNDTIAYMKIGERSGGNHNHPDAGSFQIYYKGILASDSGWYENAQTNHNKNYNSSSVAHNVLAIGSSPSDKVGAQRKLYGFSPKNLDDWLTETYQTGEVTGHEIGPDVRKPEYSYLAGDVAKAYEKNVLEAHRSMLFIPLEGKDSPAAFFVFDKVETTTSDVKKAFLLHMQEEPKVEGNVTTITRTNYGYNGKLTNQTLLPKDAKLDVIGGPGKEFMLGDTNYPTNVDPSSNRTVEAGWGRIEISPAQTNNVDYFLNVMYVGDADKEVALEKAQLIEAELVTGAKLYNHVAMFNKNKARTKDVVRFTVPYSDEQLKVNVAGLYEGTWQIKVNGNVIGSQVASKDGGMIYFTAPSGEYELTYVDANANKQFWDSGEPQNVGDVTVKLNNKYLYSDVPPVIINGRTLIPMRALLEAIGAEVSWDEATATATAIGEKEIVITENKTTVLVDGKPYELDVPAQIIDGRFMVPVRFVSENLDAKVDWNDFAHTVEISKYMLPIPRKLDIPNIIPVKNVKQSGDDGAGRTIENSVDGFLTTYWGVSGKNGAAWGIYDLGKSYTIDKIMIAFEKGGRRVYSFDIYVSEDGVNYIPILAGGKSSGTTDQFETYDINDVKARYVKYIGGANNENLWNSMRDILFIEKK